MTDQLNIEILKMRSTLVQQNISNKPDISYWNMIFLTYKIKLNKPYFTLSPKNITPWLTFYAKKKCFEID